MKRTALCSVLFLALVLRAQTVKVLFDASQAEMAGNADWVVDADTYNIGVNSSHLMVTGAGNEANPQRYPTPAQSGIISTTAQSYWKGALSYWGTDLAKRGYQVETLPYNGLITYGVSTNAQDLSNYKVFIVCEPNIRFSTSERTALVNFVQNGGGLFMVADHTISDRNSDGWDSPAIWNDLMTNNGILSNPFGLSFDLQNFTQLSSNVRNDATDPILHGVQGNVTGLDFHNGTSMTLSSTANATIKGLVYKTGVSNTGSAQAIFAASNYGSGKVCAIGDSSPPDDGSGDTNDALYVSYGTAVSGSHRNLFVNATIWLATPATAAIASVIDREMEVQKRATLGMDLYPNPASDRINVRFASDEGTSVGIELFDGTGRSLNQRRVTAAEGVNSVPIDVFTLPEGLYMVRVSNGAETLVERFIRR